MCGLDAWTGGSKNSRIQKNKNQKKWEKKWGKIHVLTVGKYNLDRIIH